MKFDDLVTVLFIIMFSIIIISSLLIVISIMENDDNREKIICIGDSITAGNLSDRTLSYEFYLGNLLPDRTIVNKGIWGQASSQILSRFNADVICQKPGYVVILAGTNDIYLGENESTIEKNLVDMYRMARNNNITPVACTMPPINIYNVKQREQLKTVNRWMRVYAADNNLALIDFYEIMCDPRLDEMNFTYTSDGVHPSKKGYLAMGTSINPGIFN